MRTRLLALLLLLLGSGHALAFDLDDLQHRLAATPDLQGRFVQQRHLADLDTDLTSRGRFRYQRDTRVVWILEQPVEDRMVFTPEDAGRLSEADGERGNDDRRRQQAATLLMNLLDGDWQALETRFAITLDGDAEAWQATLEPRQDALRRYLSRIRLAGGRYVERLAMHAANGDVLTVRFSDQRPLDDAR
ncbi:MULTISPECIES: outer membrane lipoprotein carrier protein LolA [unclassified Modicisalibacter]|uniref:outer membrane lipoprotein carrier protein LolA n=1 Tax=unclassified Modicisalibacter TaxID=2679913 RepID=UPI001CCD3440|nr:MULTISPECIES: outer membrane lipoprotein carrier protein LolA [unclassified Modicisalibacter]MBZ9559933.1 outer membrane lipoprotein carrier protein LolA [Modicisalibacter sp. R2A 31.J]MBZ9575841.1 outer membrane lipoprotein carrier protein LolA [Modicisalibacter sp. MOD 31.J]